VRAGVLLLAGVLSGCATLESGVVSEIVEGESPLPFATYSIVIDDMPGFLVPYFHDELAGLLAQHGATEVASEADVEFRLQFDAVDLDIEPPDEDPMDSVGGVERPRRFVARVTMEARRAGNPRPVLIATLSRTHQIETGAYMHDRARGAIRLAYQRILGAPQ